MTLWPIVGEAARRRAFDWFERMVTSMDRPNSQRLALSRLQLSRKAVRMRLLDRVAIGGVVC
jgi:hypothetical protein